MSSSLPTQDEQDWLLERLARLIEKRGAGPLVTAPLLKPSPRFFPDPWRPGLEGARVLAKRLLVYAGMEDFDAHVESFVDKAPHFPGAEGPQDSKHVAGCFHGFNGRRCLFSLEASSLTDPEQLVGVLAHEVAHAYRAHHGLVVEDRDEEERLTDLTTVYLGFGVLTLNNTHRFETGSYSEGARTMGYWRHSRLGYLPTQALAFLLAAQAVARRLEDKEVRELTKELGKNQTADFRSALRLLGEDAEGLTRQFHVPPPESWPKPPDLARLTESFGGLPPEPRLNEGLPVFRLREHLGVQGGLAAAFIGLVLVFGPAEDQALPWRALAFWGPVVLGVLIGRNLPRYRCAEPRCRARMKPRDTECTACGGHVAGELRDAREWEEARTALEVARSHPGGSNFLN